mmetsp:Transcript_26591/g.57156  ORF Transcript_26591/g.57156 Transcript_26591/m.57156 type:complete len:312 (-) Transcript_26591:298-1233(-)
MFSQLEPEASQSVPPERPGERKAIDRMDRQAQEKNLSAISRMILFRAFEKEPIDRLKIIKDAGTNANANSSKERIGSAAFNEASRRLRNVFGFELNRVPKYMENKKGLPPRFKDRYYMLNGTIDNNQGTHSRAIHSVHQGSSIEKGFIMLVNGLIFCKGESKANSMRKILERDLYRYLHRVDDAIPEEPPAQGTARAKARSQYRTKSDSTSTTNTTPDADALLDQCVHWDYFIKEKATEENCATQNLEEGDTLYSMGPRSAMEIGRKQIISFCASILGEEPDPSMLQEVDGDVNDGEDNDDYEDMDGPDVF